jgi:peptide/nickel transport system substrate-binding protein
VAQYVAALDLQSERSISGIELLLLEETPIVYRYWIEGLAAAQPTVGGLKPTSTGQIFLDMANVG